MWFSRKYKDENGDTWEEIPIGAIVAGGLALSLISPWLLLGAAAVMGYKWWKEWRFESLTESDKRVFFDTRDITDIDSYHMMFLGTTQEGTIRWWYAGGSYIYPQAVDDGLMYWDKKIEIKNEIFLKHLKGFYQMGNEWPEYYKSVVRPAEVAASQKQKKKRKTGPSKARDYIQVRPELPAEKRERENVYGKKEAATAAIAAGAPLMELMSAVEELEKDTIGYCPTIDFESISKST